MAIAGFMRITGEEQGPIEGPDMHDNDEGLIKVISFDHAVELMRGRQQVYGGRAVHEPIVIGKYVDKSSPKLQQALNHGETLTEVTIDWFEYTGKGVEERYFRIKLSKGLITRIAPRMPEIMDVSQDRYRFMEVVHLSYERISWAWGASGDVEFEADWRPQEG